VYREISLDVRLFLRFRRKKRRTSKKYSSKYDFDAKRQRVRFLSGLV
jgi:hypothetical protein